MQSDTERNKRNNRSRKRLRWIFGKSAFSRDRARRTKLAVASGRSRRRDILSSVKVAYSREKENRSTVSVSPGGSFLHFRRPIVREHATPFYSLLPVSILRKLGVLWPEGGWQPKRELGRDRSSGNKSNKPRHSVRNPPRSTVRRTFLLQLFLFLFLTSPRLSFVSLYIVATVEPLWTTLFYRDSLSSSTSAPWFTSMVDYCYFDERPIQTTDLSLKDLNTV